MPKDNYLEIFVNESLEQLQEVSDGLLELEKNPADPELINRIFRYMHTLKGGASLDGLERISSLAHRMENIFGLLRDNGLQLDAGDFDPVLQAVDLLTELVEGALDGAAGAVSTAEVDEALRQLQQRLLPDDGRVEGAPGQVPQEKFLTEEELQQIEQLLNEQTKLYRIRLNFKAGDMMSGVMALIISNNLESNGKYFKSFPPAAQLKAQTGVLTEVELLLVSTLSIAGVNKIIKVNCPLFEVNKIDPQLLRTLYLPEKRSQVETPVPGDDVKARFLEALQRGERVWQVVVSLPRTGPMQSLHAFIIRKNLCDRGSGCWSSPGEQQLREGGPSCDGMTVIVSGMMDRSEIVKTVRPNSSTFQVTELTAADLQPAAGVASRKKFVAPVLEVDKVLVDGLIENVGDMVLNMNVTLQMFDDLLELDPGDPAVFKAEMLGVYAQLQTTALITNALMDYGVQMRMVPVGRLFKKFPRIVRDAAKKTGKQVELVCSGERTRLDQEVVEALEAPLLHMLRNSVDHGIETPEARAEAGKPVTGRIELNAETHKNLVHITVSDDGRGLDRAGIAAKAVERGLVAPDKISELDDAQIFRMIFEPGFSTKESVSQLSGRGVGMDVVLSSIEAIRGEIKVESEPGAGSRFILIVPTAI